MHIHFNYHFYYSVSGSPMDPNSTEHKKILAKCKLCEPVYLCIHGLTSSFSMPGSFTHGSTA